MVVDATPGTPWTLVPFYVASVGAPALSRAFVVSSVVAAVLAGVLVSVGPARAGDRDSKRGALPTARVDSLHNFTLDDLDGKARSLVEWKDAKAIVLAWTAPGCPVSMVYAPRLAAIAKDLTPQGVRFVGMSSDHEMSVEELKGFVKKAGWDFPVLRDVTGAIAQRVGAATTTAVAVLDANWRIRYVGAVDDQYGVGGRKAQPSANYLLDAVSAVLGHRAVAVESTEAPGCPLTFAPTAAAPADAPTWAGKVASIMHKRCVACHAPEQGGPFPLRTYDDVKSRTATMRAAVADGRMPPWHAAGEKGTWLNDRRLDVEEKSAILAWIDAGAPAGDLEKAPAPPPVPAKDAWDIGTPDAVYEFPTAQAVPAEGVVPYRYVELKTSFPEDRWVKAVEVQPGAPDVVHHVLVAAVPAGQRVRRGGAFAPHLGFFAAMVPGARGIRYPDGMAKRLPAGATLLFQMHYTPNGIAQEDRTKIGMVFQKEPPTNEVFTAGAFALDLRIPPGEANYKAEGSLPVPFDVRVLAFMPHMHVRGTSFRYAWRSVKGGPETVICDVPKYDFNWQTPYRLATPIKIPRFSLLHCTATFDNSANNPYNPDPTATVTWGDQTWDEMMIGYVDYVKD